MTTTDPRTDRASRARESVTAFDRSDWAAVRGPLTPDFTYAETGTGLAVQGADPFVTALQAWKSAVPDAADEVLRIVEDGDTTVLEIVWRGTQTGPLQTPGGVLPPSGRPFEFRATLWQRWDGDKIAEEYHHLDVLTMLAQLGALPAPSST